MESYRFFFHEMLFMLIIDLMKTKDKNRTLLYNFVMYVKNQFNNNVQIIHSNNGKEFDFV